MHHHLFAPVALVAILAIGDHSIAAQSSFDAASAPTDWPALVQKAHKHRRMMVRRAVAGKIANAGAAAIPAVLAYEKEHGRNNLKLELLSAYGKSKAADAETLRLLDTWARDRDFYWRAQALEALANRRIESFRELFRSRLDDPSHLSRIQAGRGLCRLGDADRDRVLTLLRDPDPRVRLRTAMCLVEENDNRGLSTLVEALRQTGDFLGYPWGRIGALDASKALKKLQKKAGGEDFGFIPGKSPAENAAAIRRFEAWAKGLLGTRWVDPVPASQDAAKYTGGIEIRSCRNGDLFLRWTKDGEIAFGLEARTRLRLSADAHKALTAGPGATGKSRRGKVVCDFLQWTCSDLKTSEKTPPGRLSQETARWLESLAKALDKTGRADLSKQVSSRLAQFRSSPR